MIATIAHDLRSPAGNIKSTLELLKTNTISPEDRATFSMLIDQQLDSMISMTTEILDFAKGKSSILPRKTGVSDLLRAFENQVSGTVQEKNVDFQVSNDTTYGEIYLDIDKMCRVFVNIFKNAIESYNGQQPFFEINVKQVENEFCFTLQDRGPGIPEEIQDSLFDSFTTHGKESGTGLGLAIVKKIVEDHQGRISFETSNNGTSFFVYLKEYQPGTKG